MKDSNPLEYPNQDKLRKISVQRSDSNPGLPDIRPIMKIAAMIHYLKNKVGVVDFANAQGPEGLAGLNVRGLL